MMNPVVRKVTYLSGRARINIPVQFLWQLGSPQWVVVKVEDGKIVLIPLDIGEPSEAGSGAIPP